MNSIAQRIAAIAGLVAVAIVGWLLEIGLVLAPDQAAATAELTTLLNGLGAAVLALMAWVGALIWKRFTGGNSGGGNKGGGSGGSLPSILLTAAALSMAGLVLPSCVPLSLTSDGCVLGSYSKDGKTWKAGPCVGPDGKVDRIKVQWSNEAGQELRATIYYDKRKTLVEYHAGGGLWLQWTSKSGVVIGPVPPQVETSLTQTGEGPKLVTDVEAEVAAAVEAAK